MLRVDLLWITAALLASPLLTLCDPLYIVSAPQILKVGTKDQVFVEAQDFKLKNTLDVQIRVMNFPSNNKELFSKTVTLTSEKQFQDLVDINIPYDTSNFDRDKREKHYVYLIATFDGIHKMEKIVMVSFQSGYIFIQTDKTIYTPDSTVLFRVFPLTSEANRKDTTVTPVVVEIVTPEGIIVKREQQTLLKSQEFKLSSPTSIGIWKIAASFKDDPDKNFTTEFEVREYVLPSFEVNLTPENPFFYVDDETFSVTIRAKYLFGQEVDGSAFAVFGVISGGNKTSLRSSLARINIVNGQGKAELKKEHILQTYNTIEELIGSTLYISVSVLTESGSEMVEAERRGIHIVKEPYTIYFTRTPKYFKPGMPFDFWVYVTNPDETPAENVEVSVNPGGTTARTDKNGIGKFVINTQKESTTLDITVRTQMKGIPAENKMTAHAYTPKAGSQHYLHIDVTTGLLRVGSQLTLKLHLGTSKIEDRDFTVMILSKGRIVKVLRCQKSGSSVIAVSLDITKEMLPSFRVVAYYHVGTDEVVADSIWVDVEDTCMGTLNLNIENVKPAYNPHDIITLKITGDPGAKVNLVAVDKGIYVLNNKNRLTQTKVWDTFEKHDLACTAGSGKNSMGVFYDAGLLFMSNSAGSTPERREFSCSSEQKRKRRNANTAEVKKTLVEGYGGHLKRCCLDGMVKNLLGYTCERRAEYIEDGPECRSAFLDCCNKLAEVKKESLQGELHLARSEEEEEEDEMYDEDTTRSVFPESWMWIDEQLPDCKEPTCSQTLIKTFPGSITTWVMTAISMSKDYGICVSKPEEFIVKKNFFVDLKLPYSAIVNEQIEIKAVVYNLGNTPIKATVELKETPTICSLASYKKKYRTTVSVEAESSRAVPFVIVPLDPDQYDIEVTARSSNLGSDGVKKKLNVVTQGVLKSTGEQTLVLEPSKHGGTQRSELKRSLLQNQMPNTEAYTYIAIRGKPLSQLVNEAISGNGLDRLIKAPSGCGEQNLMAMVLPLIATHYLDKTKQWEDIGVDKRTEALGHITTGYTTELTYYKSDGSFAIYPSSKGSTWLTAYVVKMFSLASRLVRIDEDVICKAIKWLIVNTQMPDGVFIEVYMVSSSAMGGKATPLSMTAFVLIALQDAGQLCLDKVTGLQSGMDKATAYIQKNIASQSDPYAVAMASYALAKAAKLDSNVLFRFSSPDNTHWPVEESHLFTLEATGYALLALLTSDNLEKAAPVVKWLKMNQKYDHSYRSTQATAVVFEAIAQYMIAKPSRLTVGTMNVNVTSTAGTRALEVLFTKTTRGLQRSDRYKANGDLSVVASGEGEGALSIITLYYAKPDKNSEECKTFELDVKLVRNRTITYPNARATFTLSIETKYLNDQKEASMTILDIGLLTGFIPDTSDLEKLMGTDKYIQKFEINKQLSERGSLIIYLNKVSNVVKERIVFRLHKMLEVALPQPAGITVYEYYATENRCVKFYDVTERTSGRLPILCPTEVCNCAEANCPQLRGPEVPDEKLRIKEACNKRDFAYKAKLKEIKQSGLTYIYVFTIVDPLKAETDQVQPEDQRDFLTHSQCKTALNLQVGKDYLIMGPEPKKVKEEYRYIIGLRTWLEYWPTTEESQADLDDNKNRYNGLAELKYTLNNFKCTT